MTRILQTFRFLIIFVILGLMTGCWDRNEMDDLALVMASGIDLTDDGQLEITLQIALPTGIPSAVQSGERQEISHRHLGQREELIGSDRETAAAIVSCHLFWA